MKISVNNKKIFELKSIEKGIPNFKGIKSDIKVLSTSKDEFLLTVNGKVFRAFLIEKDTERKTMLINVNGNEYEVSLKDRHDELLEKMGMQNGTKKSSVQLKAPMPGLVLNVLVKAGQKVEKDDPIIVLEAMKMENVLKAPYAATIKTIKAKNSDSVEKNEVLVIFE